MNTLTPAKKMAIKICKDVFARLRYRKLKRGNGYVVFNVFENVVGQFGNIHQEAQPLIPKIEKNCTVCALGAMMLSHVRINDNCSMRDLAYSSGCSIREALKDYFSQGDLYLIESVFECDGDYYPIAKKYKHPKTRMRAIMLNVIKNNGVFKSDRLL